MADGNNIPLENKPVADGDDKVTVEYKPNRDAEADGIDGATATGRTPLTPVHQRRNSRIPILFERAAKSWWDPKFDTTILEEQHEKIFLPQTRKRFQYALGYIILSCIAWCMFFAVMRQTNYWIAFLSGCVVLMVITASVLGFSFTKTYESYVTVTSVFISMVVGLFCLLYFVYPHKDMSAVGAFTGSIEILLMMYTVIPLPLYMCVGIGTIYSVVFELLSDFITDMNDVYFIVARVLIHTCIHLIGVHIFIMSQVRRRSTFLKVGQSIMSHSDLEVEKSLKHQIIHSLMPPQVAAEVMKSHGQDDQKKEDEEHHNSKKTVAHQLNFRSFHMDQMNDVSILFADIVGFTKMSSNKTAEQLVSLLNDLFGRFDEICKKCGCEKISTLGDCYYCVSGCPEPREDHAICCVEMGLSMCKAIEEFDRDHNEEVDMRVGVHTGSVLCGLVGTRRFKFDVWSHDVTLANTMESTGKPGRVHISDQTLAFVKDRYEVELGDDVQDIRSRKKLTECFDPNTQQYIVKHVEERNVIKTWFIKGRKETAPVPGSEVVDEANTKSDKETPAQTDSVKITVEQADNNTQQDEAVVDQLEKEADKNTTNHLETSHTSQADAELSTASLLGKRDNLTSSAEDIEVDIKADGVDVREQLRIHEQTDKRLIKTINEDYERAVQYLYKPPINQCTLQFTDPELEARYHRHYLEDKDVIYTLALPKFSALCDMIVSCIFFILISICCFLRFEPGTTWIAVFTAALIFEIFMLLPLICVTCFLPTMGRLRTFFTSWSIRHLFGCIIASLPCVAVYTNFRCAMTDMNTLFYGLLLVASLLHYCNFTMLSSWMKSTLATVAGLVLLVLWAIDICSMELDFFAVDNMNDTESRLAYNRTSLHPLTNIEHEIILNIILFLVLVWFLNREFEISYRLCFHGAQNAQKDRLIMQREKEQADWLLHNIIPEHVANIIKKTSKYCENHQDIGVIFASVTNFDNFYDETYEGGKEYLRVLNELMGDFEELFDNPKYKDIEKIKTIGSCLMAASGLNPNTRKENKDPNSHLYALMDFSIDLLHQLEQFNAEIFNFDFNMKIGYNFGPVTSGVIGSSKLLYDIWGDTVNISSRMYSTGVEGKIQVTEDTAVKLGDKFEFEYRGKTFVKGKGDMSTYLLVRKKPGATWE